MTVSTNPSVADLVAAVHGPVLLPTDAGFAEEVAVWNVANPHRPWSPSAPPAPPTSPPRSAGPGDTGSRSPSRPPATARSAPPSTAS